MPVLRTCRWCCDMADFKQTTLTTNQKNRPFGLWFCGLLEIRHATALTTGAKHWHRQKAVFYVFCFCATNIYPLNPDPPPPKKNRRLVVPLTR